MQAAEAAEAGARAAEAAAGIMEGEEPAQAATQEEVAEAVLLFSRMAG